MVLRVCFMLEIGGVVVIIGRFMDEGAFFRKMM